MPGLDGFATAAMVHRHPRFEHTPIIFVTAVNVTDLDRVKGYELGAIDYVYVPIVPEILRSKVTVLVELHRKRRELERLNTTLAGRNAMLARANAELEESRARELEELNRVLARANEQLREADRRKDEFLAILGHELRNPLAPIRNAAQIMSRRPSVDAELADLHAVIARQVEHLAHLVDDLLDVGRITRGKITLQRAPTAMATVLERAIELARPLVEERGHELHLALPDEDVIVDGDPVRLAQIVGNLLNNAARYTPPRGQIWLAVESAGAEAVVRVCDNGIGIPPDRLDEVFEMFTQVAEPPIAGPRGLGIGLALVRRLVEMHGGRVHAASPGLGQGSEFVVALPAVPGASAPPADLRAAPAGVPAGARSRRILVADDNRDAAQMLALMLRMEGHEVLVAHDGLEALDVAKSFQPELVLLDLGMPRLDGYETAKRIRTEPWGATVPLVALTGWGQEDDRRRTAESGFSAHCVKPVAPEQIIELVSSLAARDAVADGSREHGH